MLKSKSLWGSASATNARSQLCNARSSRTDHCKRSRARFRHELGVAAPARGFTQAVPPRRLPLAAANSRPKQVQKQNGTRHRTKNRRAWTKCRLSK